jgi:hypothetical protein
VDEKVKEYTKVKEQLLRSKRAVMVLTGEDAEKMRQDTAQRDLLNPLEQRRQKYGRMRKSNVSACSKSDYVAGSRQRRRILVVGRIWCVSDTVIVGQIC